MARIVKQNLPLVRSEVPRKEALQRFAAENEIYKVELINDLPEDAVISLYTQGDFTDLCAGPHCPSTGRVKAFKLMSIAGAYWRGNEKNKMLQRIYGTAFASKEDLDAYLHMLEEAENATTANWARNWTSSASTTKARASRSSTPTACACATPFSITGTKCIASTTTKRS